MLSSKRLTIPRKKGGPDGDCAPRVKQCTGERVALCDEQASDRDHCDSGADRTNAGEDHGSALAPAETGKAARGERSAERSVSAGLIDTGERGDQGLGGSRESQRAMAARISGGSSVSCLGTPPPNRDGGPTH